MAFLVFLAGAAGTGIVPADFGAGANGLRRFGLGGSCLVLQLFLLALLLAFHFARKGGELRGGFVGDADFD